MSQEVTPDFVLSNHDYRGIMRLSWAINEFRTIQPKITANQIAAFLAVATKPGLGPTDYSRVLQTIQPVASRWLLDMGPKSRDGEGLGLLDRRPDPRSLRQIQYHLTADGLKLAEKLAGIVVGR